MSRHMENGRRRVSSLCARRSSQLAFHALLVSACLLLAYAFQAVTATASATCPLSEGLGLDHRGRRTACCCPGQYGACAGASVDNRSQLYVDSFHRIPWSCAAGPATLSGYEFITVAVSLTPLDAFCGAHSSTTGSLCCGLGNNTAAGGGASCSGGYSRIVSTTMTTMTGREFEVTASTCSTGADGTSPNGCASGRGADAEPMPQPFLGHASASVSVQFIDNAPDSTKHGTLSSSDRVVRIPRAPRAAGARQPLRVTSQEGSVDDDPSLTMFFGASFAGVAAPVAAAISATAVSAISAISSLCHRCGRASHLVVLGLLLLRIPRVQAAYCNIVSVDYAEVDLFFTNAATPAECAAKCVASSGCFAGSMCCNAYCWLKPNPAPARRFSGDCSALPPLGTGGGFVLYCAPIPVASPYCVQCSAGSCQVCVDGCDVSDYTATACAPCPSGSFFSGFTTVAPFGYCSPCASAGGSYCLAGGTNSSGVPCTAGNYCAGGAALPQACSCAAGSFCPPGSANAAGISCPHGSFCAAGVAAQPVPCSAGYYCVSGSTSATQFPCACAGGNYCPAGSSSSLGIACIAGSYCGIGGTAPPQLCSAGYYCQSGALSSNQFACSCTVGSYCPAGSSASNTCISCIAGNYCAGSTSQPLTCSCAAGSFCPSGSASAAGISCPLGSFCAVGGAAQPVPCSAGYYCVSGSTSATQFPCACAAGNYCPAGSSSSLGIACIAGSYCGIGGTAPPQLCSAGYYCLDGSSTATQHACTCSTGNYCTSGSSASGGVTCTAGNYCTGGAAQPVSCSCSSGFFCPLGSVAAAGTPCTASGYFCAGGSAQPGICSCGAGSYCAGRGTNSGSCARCPRGSYCVGGAGKTPCPSGRYGSVDSESSPMCAGPCVAAAGYYCAAGATSATGQVCPIGSYCPSGSGYPSACPAGRYGIIASESMPMCAGPCVAAAGYYCAAGAISATGLMCTCSAGYASTSTSYAPCATTTGTCSTAGAWPDLCVLAALHSRHRAHVLKVMRRHPRVRLNAQRQVQRAPRVVSPVSCVLAAVRSPPIVRVARATRRHRSHQADAPQRLGLAQHAALKWFARVAQRNL